MARNWWPWVLDQVEAIEDRFNLIGSTYTGHDDTNGYGERYAADFWTTDKAKHDAVFAWFVANAESIGGLYIISRDRIWNILRRAEGVRHYERDANNDGVLSASERHTNHVHISFDPNNPPEEDMPTAKENALELLRTDGEIENVWHDDGNAYLVVKNAFEEIGRDGNRIELAVKRLNDRQVAEGLRQAAQSVMLGSLESKLDAILAILSAPPTTASEEGYKADGPGF
jgi:hypothetical protein